ncbi:hypothetical protein B0H17DRAFT_1324595 [Mycena rosella]|uniref:Uncharacterized protein n=1 Tax=Mycena rosella TaxID=1033263 RepID=A0AAD7H1S7_MYCRO|nr:hypothetical protein B0H17DRAFT_1324595 [Mycena rosella]
MYSDPRLDTPPPQSQFRRPWSPDPYDPLPSTQNSRNTRQYHEPYSPAHHYPAAELDFQPDYGYDYPKYGSAPRRREASDVSVEALDLADYAMTLRAHQANPYQGRYGQDMYPPSPPASRPLAARPPSVVSRMDTLSSNTQASSSRGGRNPSRRPFSLPPPSIHSHSARSHPTSPRSANSHNYPYLPNFNPSPRQAPHSSEPDIDTAHFPAWSKNWYNKPKPAPASAPDIYTALPPSAWSPKRSPFDPGNTFRPDSFPSGGYDPYGHPSSSLGYDSSRDLLPWSSEPPEYGPGVDSSIKEERMRMLEREFGPNAKSKGLAENGDFLDENGKPLIGTVDSKGQLVTKSNRARLILRVAQIVLSLGAAIPAIYAALVIKPKDKPPPSGSIAAYVLYVFSVLTFIILLWLFAFRPCCCAGKRRKPGPGGNALSNGMMVLPVSGLPGGKKHKAKGGKNAGKRGGNGMPGGDVQVNLIVDPNAFGGGRQDEDDDTEEEDDEEGSVPGSFDPASARRKRKRAKRRSVFAGLAMEADWKRARSWAKKVTAVDIFGILLWGAVFIFMAIGKHCPPGGFEGWCNAWNTSLACACFLCLSFGVGTFFDIQDLASSKVSPRTRS